MARKTNAHLLSMWRVKMKVALLFLSLAGFSIIPEGTIRSCPSGEKQSRLKKDFSVSSWKRHTTLPWRSELSGTGNCALLMRLTNFLLLTLYTRHILHMTKIVILLPSLTLCHWMFYIYIYMYIKQCDTQNAKYFIKIPALIQSPFNL